MSSHTVTRAVIGNALTIGALILLGIGLLGIQAEPITLPSFDRWRLAWAGACVAIYALVSVALYRRSARISTVAHTGASADAVAVESVQPPVGVIFASQTGFAEELAQRTVTMLRAAGLDAYAQSLGQTRNETLANSDAPLLFVVSTTGEGDAPDDAMAFTRRLMATAPDLSKLRYGLLALGDREYEQFCGFGRALDAWLTRHGALSLFDAVEVDNGDDAALRHWHHHVALFAGRTDLPDWQPPRYATWRLEQRTLLNPGSQGDPCFLVALTPPDGVACDWRAGDIVEIGPRNDPAVVADYLSILATDASRPADAGADDAGSTADIAERLSRSSLPSLSSFSQGTKSTLLEQLTPLPHREYSIASLPADDRLELIVRQMHRPDGRLGIGSGWLTEHAPVGTSVSALVRRNAGFHPPPDTMPMILIGNGTGLAGLRAHLKARVANGRRRNWLIFGERNIDHDFLLRDEILGWRATGWIERLDLAFSRDQAGKIYVQDRLREHADEVRRWLDDGAAIYVCGSLAGMAPGVHSVLAALVGDDALADLAAAGRYRRDVY